MTGNKDKALRYQKKNPREHVLLRPDTYVGDIEATKTNMWVSNTEDNNIEKREIKFVPGFFKTFDELMVNSRDASVNDPTCDTIKVNINQEENYIEVYNNGQDGIPVVIHPEENIYVPSMIFGELLTSSNYDDSEKKTTGGRNGYGAKLANIFSKKFIVEVGDAYHNKKFVQVFENNLEVKNKPKVTKYSKKNSYVKISYYPDLDKFGLKDIDNDHFCLFKRRCMDIAGTALHNVNVHFNGEKIKVNNFKKYMELYYPGETFILDESNKRWKIGCLYRPDNGNEVISFVNGISTYNGGTHANHVIDQVIKKIKENIEGKNKEVKVSPGLIKENLVFFINSIIENPKFGSQTKESLTSKPSNFGSTYKATEAFLKKIAKSGIVDLVTKMAVFKQSATLKKTDGKKKIKLTGIPKLEDANKAGSKDSYKCSLILTEGDSAKAFAMSGLGVVGRNYFGVFPLKGKLLNVREASAQQILKNDEINHLKQIIGLKQNINYKEEEYFKQLRYGRVIILTDQDFDGSHIKGLVMNFFHVIWPELVHKKGFITSLATPIVKLIKGKKIKTFYNMSEYQEFLEELKDKNETGWKTKYYKGLGTSTSQEAKEYFHDIEDKLINYFYDSAISGMNDTDVIDDSKTVSSSKSSKSKKSKNIFAEKTKHLISDDDDAITLAFDKSRADERKEWLKKYDPDRVLKYEEKQIRYKDFINKDLIHFSNDDVYRSIPSLIDGFKPSQRKIYYGANLRGLDKIEVKVAQLAGFVSDKAAYHHGEMSLNGAIISMAQDFVGSNNINVLKPKGQFGCLDPETDILLWNGQIKKAKNIDLYDTLVGDDGLPRKILKLTSGEDDMYKITTSDNKTYTINSQHIITLHFPNNGNVYFDNYHQKWHLTYFNDKTIIEKSFDQKNYPKLLYYIKRLQNCSKIIDIKIKDYLELNDKFKENLFMMSNHSSIQWKRNNNYDDPYILGQQLIKEKNIPHNYLFNSADVRQQVLMGVMSTSSNTRSEYIEININQLNDNLIKDLQFLASSLGLYNKVNNNAIVIKNILHENCYNLTKFDVESIGKGEFVGWQVDKNERFLLGNFIITHNSRLLGGKDSASPRYIWTQFDDLTKLVFRQEDDPILDYLFEDTDQIEPTTYYPIIPMVLVNGADGIGTGFSTKLPNYNPIDIIHNIKNKIKGEDFIKMNPWYSLFKGEIKKVNDYNFVSYGNYQIDGDNLIITELPVGEWTTPYKQFLEKKEEIEANKKNKNKIVFLGFEDENTDNEVYFKLKFKPGYLDKTNKEEIEKEFKLCKKISLTNIHLFNDKGIIQKFDTIDDVMDEFYVYRLNKYIERKKYQLDKLNRELEFISWKVKFILMVIDKKIKINNKKKSVIEEKLVEKGFPKLSKNNGDKNYDYLLSMPLWNLTHEKVEELKKHKENKETEYDELENKPVEQIWTEELEELENKYHKWYQEKNERYYSSDEKPKKSKSKKKKSKSIKIK